MTARPSLASRSATAAPIPREAPVTTATATCLFMVVLLDWVDSRGARCARGPSTRGNLRFSGGCAQCIVRMFRMRMTQLRQADLNLLVVFAALAEARSVSRAAEQLLLSQPAVSRALQRLRDMFHDDLLVRGQAGYQPTPLGQRLITELQVMLPRLDRLLTGASFDPNAEEARFRVVVTDNASHVVCPVISRSVLSRASKVTFDFVAWHDGAFEALERGRLDLLLNADDGNLPPHFSSEVLYEDEFVCVVDRE